MNLLAALIFGTTLYYEKPIQQEPTRDTLIEHHMALLSECESTNRPDAINYNDGAAGLHSYGRYQIQLPTAHWWNDLYDLGLYIDEQTIMDGHVQRLLTYTALKNGMAHHWSCAYKTGIL